MGVAQVHCPSCGKVVVPGATTCQECGSQIAGAGPAPLGSPGAPPAQPPVPRARQRTSGWAIASLVLGVCGFTCIPLIGAILAIVFGFLAVSYTHLRAHETRHDL